MTFITDLLCAQQMKLNCHTCLSLSLPFTVNSMTTSQSIPGAQNVSQHYTEYFQRNQSHCRQKTICHKSWPTHPLCDYCPESLQVVLALWFTKSMPNSGCLWQEWQQQGNLTPAQSIAWFALHNWGQSDKALNIVHAPTPQKHTFLQYLQANRGLHFNSTNSVFNYVW